MPASRSRRFCQALLEETGGEVLRWASITAIAGRLGLEQEDAEALAAELDEQNLVRVVGGQSVRLTENGRQACQRAVKVGRPPLETGRAKARAAGRVEHPNGFRSPMIHWALTKLRVSPQLRRYASGGVTMVHFAI